jgi:hypothetical protein
MGDGRRLGFHVVVFKLKKKAVNFLWESLLTTYTLHLIMM